ncbi:MAG TPA: NAD(P)-dependent oxidoreductase [Pseudonocardia sp.]|jgi:nucleoside-diphosphate-sugar epimerase
MRIFLAGATGAVGRPLVPMLLAAGHRVIGTSRTDRGVTDVRALGAEPVRLDVFDADALRDAVRAAAPDLVMHQLTALGDGDLAANARIRRVGTRALVDAAHAAGVRRIVAQSISWAYAPGDTPADEATPLDPTEAAPRAGSVAGVRALEDAVGELERAVVLRYGTLYGPGTWYAPHARVAGQLSAGELLADDAVSSLLHVEDAARAAVAALDWPAGPVNVCDDEPAAAREWLPALAAALGERPPPLAPGRAGWQRGASNALAARLGWKPRYSSWRDGFGSLS